MRLYNQPLDTLLCLSEGRHLFDTAQKYYELISFMLILEFYDFFTSQSSYKTHYDKADRQDSE